jgi:isoleucyl-tRNA synthetase
LESVGTRGRAPYKSVLTHGFVLDGQGRKMSKSMGNVVAPEDVIKKLGADILRLWCAAQDYRDDNRISQEILNRVAEAYRRIRNTCRYLLANLHDFNPATETIPFEQLPELDRWALHQLELLKERVLTAYQELEFHVIYQEINAFCAVEMSAFYLDILKDRLYTSPANSHDRWAAQTVMYRILDNLLRLLAPLLSFTADEAWAYLPGEHEASVHLAAFPRLTPEVKDDALVQRWERIMKIRAEVLKALEQARVAKTIGLSLDAAVTLAAQGELREFLEGYAADLPTILIVSQVRLLDALEGGGLVAEGVEGLQIAVAAARGEKCERCWHYSEQLGTDSNHPTICPTCAEAVH